MAWTRANDNTELELQIWKWTWTPAWQKSTSGREDSPVKWGLPLQISCGKLIPHLFALTPHEKRRDPQNSYAQKATPGGQEPVLGDVVLSTLLLLIQPHPCRLHSPPHLNHSWGLSVPATWRPLPTPGFFCLFCLPCSLTRPETFPSLSPLFTHRFPWKLSRRPTPLYKVSQLPLGKLLTILINNLLCDSLFNVHLLWQTIYFKRMGTDYSCSSSVSFLPCSARHLWGLGKHWSDEYMDDQGNMGAYSEWQELLNEMNVRFQTQNRGVWRYGPFLRSLIHSFI